MSMMGELTFFLGLQIQQTEEGNFICQTKYTKELIQKFCMSKAKSIGTPMSPTTNLDKDEQGTPVDETKYRGMIGSLLYLTASRPDIMFSVCKCAMFQSAPKESHLTAVKRIIRYLIGTFVKTLSSPMAKTSKKPSASTRKSTRAKAKPSSAPPEQVDLGSDHSEGFASS
ncbi:PREDICTED: uncharacterized protein LOC109240431 [Nicotiana attenuata]|uniref:uncharacterized protein LOC109240431 n=1 Tax=Nicotiana attenuata TaxID=49451 RepID=UPI0009052474|nr:PREDICTED: uncharacterized protein LOC109240431 [Nicotiana attenuata]